LQENELKDKETAAAEQAQEKEQAQAADEAKAADDAAEQQAEQAEAAEAEADPKDAQIEELQRRLLRLQADFENFRRRTAKEKEELSSFVTAGVVGKFLKILDNFERAEASAGKGDNVEAVLAGMQKIRRQFEDTFKELQVKEIEAQDAKFDPNLHEAVMRGQNPDLEDETIDMVFEKGYKLGDKVIRHSKVRVINND
jgi:molecular chaperone GrpE